MSLGIRRSVSSDGFAAELRDLASVAGLAIPALGIVVVDPLMSLLDTACIGRTSSTQLAALTPASSVFGLIFQVRCCCFPVDMPHQDAEHAVRPQGMRSELMLPPASSRTRFARIRTDTFAYALRPGAMFAQPGVTAQHVHQLAVQTFTFIGVSVTNVLACNSPGAPAISDQERKRRIAASQKLQSYAIFASACCGVACTAGCLIFSRPLLRLMGANEELLPLSLPYLRIRCLAAPAVMIMNACQGAFLGQQNTVTPLAIFVAAAVCNATMGVTFVLGFGWGLQGAAMATASVQVRCRSSVQRATAFMLQH